MNNAQASSGKLSWTTRVAYGLGDTAQNVVWGAMSILTFFYTDYEYAQKARKYIHEVSGL